MYKDTAQHVFLILNKNIDYSTPILFMPFKAATPTITNSTPIKNIKTNQQEKVQKSLIPQAPTVIPQPEQKPTTSIEALSLKESVETKETKKSTPASPTTPQKKQPPTKEINKKIIEPQKILSTPAAIPAQKKNPQPIKNINSDATKSHIPPIPENTQISDNFRHVEALRKGAQLQKELVTQWKPPLGAAKDSCCEIEFTIDKTGHIQKYAMIKSSGNLLYDISAKQALYSCTMPRWTYEKSLTISFIQ